MLRKKTLGYASAATRTSEAQNCGKYKYLAYVSVTHDRFRTRLEQHASRHVRPRRSSQGTRKLTQRPLQTNEISFFEYSAPTHTQHHLLIHLPVLNVVINNVSVRSHTHTRTHTHTHAHTHTHTHKQTFMYADHKITLDMSRIRESRDFGSQFQTWPPRRYTQQKFPRTRNICRGKDVWHMSAGAKQMEEATV